PFALLSMTGQLTDRQVRTLYDFPSGQAITADSLPVSAETQDFVKIAAIDLDEGAGTITLAISGHRVCTEGCPQVSLTVVSLDDDAAVRRALPLSKQLTLKPGDVTFSDTVQLPIRGQPIQYPFDNWIFWLGIAGTIVDRNGENVELTPQLVDG